MKALVAIALVSAAVACGGASKSPDTTSVQVSYAASSQSPQPAIPTETKPAIAPALAAAPQPALHQAPAPKATPAPVAPPASPGAALRDASADKARKKTPPKAKPKPTAAPKPGQVRVVLTGLRNTKGLARLALFTTKNGFPENHKKAFAKANARIKGSSASAVFKKIPAGKFAVVVLHDENKDGKMEKNFIGVPKEGFGVSRNPKVRMRAPRFGEAALRLAPGQKAKVVIRMKYM